MSDPNDQGLATAEEARDVAEAAREAEWEHASFARGLFEGRFALDLVHPFPEPDPEEQERAQDFFERLEEFAVEKIDGDAIDREKHVPQEVLDGLAELGAYGIKIPEEYGGLGLSQYSYERALQIVASRCASTGAFLSAHQSIGVPQPLLLFGTEEQKEKYLPRICDGALSAFALTEPDVGSDPANLATTAEPTEDGEAWILNGEKLWTTNGPRADLVVVMARTPVREESRSKRPISAFIVETDWEGVEVGHVCDFMGIRGISNGVLKFDNVRVPKENLIWEEGRGLKLALVTLNTGRLSLPAFCAAAGKSLTNMSRKWAAERVQWGAPIGKHDAVAQMLGRMAADSFAMQAAVDLTALMADSKDADIRIEASIAKMWHSEKAWEIGNDALQIRGGRGYETADSLRERGEAPLPVERTVRDLRINLIFEGSSEIMRLFIAREAVDAHLKVAGDLVDPKASLGAKAKALLKAGLHYAWWYPTRWMGWGRWPRYREFGELAGHVRYVDRTTRRLARAVFHAMIRFGPALEKKQAVLGRIVEIGAELFMMTAACSRAKQMVDDGETGDRSPAELADLFCRHAERRIEERFDVLFQNDDSATYKVAQRAMEGRYAWLEKDVVTMEAFDRPMITETEVPEAEVPVATTSRGAGSTTP
ncbi:MAG: acyl-CoA dehydrogenase family protein [Longimicrobiales bacterium]|nr:acyl-CoA dehydrogenase family protein [Longimicrobiales bacterium]